MKYVFPTFHNGEISVGFDVIMKGLDKNDYSKSIDSEKWFLFSEKEKYVGFKFCSNSAIQDRTTVRTLIKYMVILFRKKRENPAKV